MSFILPPFLKPGDTIAIAAPARSTESEIILPAIVMLREKGFRVRVDEEVYRRDRQFAGTDEERAAHMNRLFADPSVRAVWCARGGYGSARMVDRLDFSLLHDHPKWLTGFSDITTLLSHAQRHAGIAVMHATMPVFMHNREGVEYDEVKDAIDSLTEAWCGKFRRFDLRDSEGVNKRDFSGTVTGGNLSVLYSLNGTPSEPVYDDSILFLEDLDEYYYHIDRMLLALKRSGRLSRLKALIVGSFTSMHDHQVPFGYTVEEIILQHLGSYGYPIIFGMPSGHLLRNLALPFGVHAEFKDGILTFVGL